jgi:hypothetical protein
LWWIAFADGKPVGEGGCTSREQMVTFINDNKPDELLWCPDRNPSLVGAWVHVHSNGRIDYVQTVADGRKTDNLLALPLR